MGSIVEGSCPCGYESGSLFLGSGLDRADSVLRLPAICGHCRGIVAVDLNSAARECPACGGTDLKALGRLHSHRGGLRRLAMKPPDIVAIGRWTLPDVAYRCPECGEQTLRFVMAGAWD